MSPTIMVWNLDNSGANIYVDASWVAFTGQAREQAIGEGWQLQLHPADLALVLKTIQTSLSACRNFTIDCRVRRADGDYIWFLVTAIAQVDRAGIFTGYLGTYVDIAERKQMEISVQQSEIRLRRILENMPVLLFANSDLPAPIFWNKECERVTGYSADEIIDNPHAVELLYPDEADRQQMIQQWWENRGDYTDWEATLTRKDGEKRTISWTSIAKAFPIEGWTSWSIGIDVTHRKWAEQRAQSLQALTSHLSEALTPQEVTQLVLSHLQKMLPDAHTAGIRLPNETRQNFEFITAEQGQPHTLPFSSIIEAAYTTGKPVWIPNPEMYHSLYPADASEQQGTQAMVALPLHIGEKSPGVLAVGFLRDQSFTDEEREFISTIARQCAQALERANLYVMQAQAREEAERRIQWLAHLQTVTAALSRPITTQEVAQIVIDQGLHILGATTGTFHLLSEDKSTFEIIYLTGSRLSETEQAKWRRYPASPDFPVTDVVRLKQPLWYGLATEVVHDYPAMAAITHLYPGAAVFLPIIVGDEAIGVLNFVFEKTRLFSDEEKRLIIALSQQCAQALERVQLAEQAQTAVAMHERQRLARDLHDAVSQTLFSATTISESLPRLWERDPQKTLFLLNQVTMLNRAAMAEMRTLLLELRPDAILKTDLNTLFTHLIEAAKGRKRITPQLISSDQHHFLPPDVHEAFYRIAQEAINNILKHSHATQFTITLDIQPDQATLTIEDNGRGFEHSPSFAGFGLYTMQERANAVKAAIEIESQPGNGTRISVRRGL